MSFLGKIFGKNKDSNKNSIEPVITEIKREPTVPRDKRKDESHFISTLQRVQTKNEEHIKYLEKENVRPIAYFMVSSGLYVEFCWRYSLGEDLENLKMLYDKILDYYTLSLASEDDIYNDTLYVISLGILFGTDKEKLQKLYESIEKHRLNDLIFSSMLHPILHTKEIYPKLRFKKNKSSLTLEKIFTSNKVEAEQLMKEYLEKTYYTKGNISDGWYNKEDSSGCWSWEATAIVKVLNLDDSDFKDNEYYPYDLAHWNE